MQADKKIDANGMTCALVAVKVAEALRGMSKGEVLEVVADAHGVQEELRELARLMGVEYSGEEPCSHFIAM